MLKTRVLSSIVILPPVLGAIWWGGLPFIILLSACGAGMAWELYKLVRAPGLTGHIILVAICAATASVGPILGYEYAFPWLVAATAIGWLLLRRARIEILDLTYTMAVFMLVLFTIVSASWLRLEMVGGRPAVFWLVAVIAATDIGAYFIGRAIGGPKLAPKISPNKTWAGLLGGVLFAALTGYVAARIAERPEWITIVIASAVAAPVAQIGDLLESWIKRRMGVKDSSALIPGHGGILDRLDGYLTATPLVALIALLHRGVF